jgi:hypothetical protein
MTLDMGLSQFRVTARGVKSAVSVLVE